MPCNFDSVPNGQSAQQEALKHCKERVLSGAQIKRNLKDMQEVWHVQIFFSKSVKVSLTQGSEKNYF